MSTLDDTLWYYDAWFMIYVFLIYVIYHLLLGSWHDMDLFTCHCYPRHDPSDSHRFRDTPTQNSVVHSRCQQSTCFCRAYQHTEKDSGHSPHDLSTVVQNRSTTCRTFSNIELVNHLFVLIHVFRFHIFLAMVSSIHYRFSRPVDCLCLVLKVFL